MDDYAAMVAAAEHKRRRGIVTPEGVELELRLGSRGQRAAAFLLDLLFMLLFLIAFSLAMLWGAKVIGPGALSAAVVMWLIGFFVLRNFYFILMEMSGRGATFGKRIARLRVVSRSGGRLTGDAVIARNLMREIEIYLPLSFLLERSAQGSAGTLITIAGLGWTGIFLFFPFFNKDRLRVGDLLAGTWVIATPKRRLSADLLAARDTAPAVDFTDAQLDVYGIFELHTLEGVLRDGNSDAIGSVAHTIRTKIGHWDGSDNIVFLNAYYHALRARLERGMLFGRRRESKFSA